MNKITKELRVYGIVQGVGFRPTVDRHAHTAGITGTVCNKGPYVEVMVQGTEEGVTKFVDLLNHEPPRRAAILKIDEKDVEDAPEYDAFTIIESKRISGEIFISPDIAICEDCQRELYDPKDRRYLHPFINCTSCGPRLTILDELPYDRERTSMKRFPMCPTCAHEYHDPASRRYDAQPVCCNECGPEVFILDTDMKGREAITYARKMLIEGKIVAIKGIGGFHLACDATNNEAVQLLRRRKHRPVKPFALMMRNQARLEKECMVTDEWDVILGHQKPIVLLPKKEGSSVAEAVAPGNPKIGVMLPYAPLQCLLFDYDDGLKTPEILVMTSANISGAPIVHNDEEARSQILNLTDCIMTHNRDIRIRCDDTVMDFYHHEPYMIRRSRGYAPLPYILTGDYQGRVLAVGGELKNTFCLGINNLMYPSSYIGDLSDLRTVDALKETISRFEELLEMTPDIIACDAHPNYQSNRVAHEYGLPVVEIQHHYAHIVSCMAENDCHDQVIGVSFDGTGYGLDETIWGGEFLICDEEDFTRAGHISRFLQIGGDCASKEGWRIAVSMIYGLYRDEEKTLEIVNRLQLCEEKAAKVIMKQYERKINSVTSTSAGRLFDAVSAILRIRKASTYESEASTMLQFEAQKYHEDLEYKESLVKDHVLRTDKIFKQLLTLKLQEGDSSKLAYLFHKMLAEGIVEMCHILREDTSLNTVALSGGVFQNTLLLELCETKLKEDKFDVLIHHLVPPNDGGIALGQAVVAMNRYMKGEY